jgi:hypothetical protein
VARGVTVPGSSVRLDIGSEGLVQISEADEPSWSVDRDLAGGSLPGQVRAAVGFAVGSGELVIRDAQSRTPWTTSRLRPGGVVQIDAKAHAGDVDTWSGSTAGAPVPVARMVATSVSAPSALSGERAVSITDDVQAMRAPLTVPSTLLTGSSGGVATISTDAAWLIYLAAKAGGRFAVPPPVPSAILAAPLCGGFAPEVGGLITLADPGVFWQTDTLGRMYAFQEAGEFALTSPVALGETVYVTWTGRQSASGSVTLRPELDSGSNYVYLTLSNTTLVLTVKAAGASPIQAVGSWSLPTGVAYPGRVQWKLERLSATQTRASVRGSLGGAWSTPVTVTHLALESLTKLTNFEQVAGLQVSRLADDALWTPPTAVIAASESPLASVVGVGEVRAWDVAQEVAAATMGALWVDEQGVLIYRARDRMRGAGEASGTITADGVVDLPWSLSIEDVADRVEVSYRPPTIAIVEDYSLTAWTAESAVKIGPGKTVQVMADLGDAAVSDVAPFYALWDGPAGVTTYSRWAAAKSASGGGTAPADGALRISTEVLSPSRIRLSITNTTADTLWTVNGSGESTLVLRSNIHVTPGEAVTIAAGLSATDARNPLVVDLGPWVQDEAVANEMLSWLVSMTSTPQPVLPNVEVEFDPTVRLGDVRQLVDPAYTGISAKVLVAGTHLERSAGALVQTLRLVVLSTMFDDLDRAFVELGVTTFDQLDTYMVANGITTFDDLDNWLFRLGGL